LHNLLSPKQVAKLLKISYLTNHKQFLTMATIIKKLSISTADAVKMVSNFAPSIYQQAVYDFIKFSNGNCVIDAVAGSGKSTTIVNALRDIAPDKKVLFLAFNKAIVEELKLKIGNLSNVTVKTLHSLGGSAVMRTFKSVLDNNKYRTYINDGIRFGAIRPTVQLLEEEVLDYKSNIVKLTDLCRAYLCNDLDTLEGIAFKYDLNLLDNECGMALNVVYWGENNVGTIDFTDMIYLPNVKSLNTEVYDYVFIDECQDLNSAQRELMLQCVNPNGGRFVAVGDPRQAIYGFAGADVESFNILKNLPNTTMLPLSVCYRCGSDIITLAKVIVPQIEAREGADSGAVIRNAKLESIKDGDMILCRVTAPLVALCMQYISEGTKAYVKGRDIGANLINMINKSKRRNIEDVLSRLSAEGEKIADKVQRKTRCSIEEARESSMYSSHMDKVQAIIVLSGDLKTTDAVIGRIEKIFKDEERNGICLSTIHKSKGLESNNVYIICEEKMMLKRAMKLEWTRVQEINLVYVAYTRAKKVLGFVTDFEFK